MNNLEQKDINFMEAFHKKGMLTFAISMYGQNITTKEMAKESLDCIESLIYLMPSTKIPSTDQTRYLNILKTEKAKLEKKMLTL